MSEIADIRAACIGGGPDVERVVRGNAGHAVIARLCQGEGGRGESGGKGEGEGAHGASFGRCQMQDNLAKNRPDSYWPLRRGMACVRQTGGSPRCEEDALRPY